MIKGYCGNVINTGSALIAGTAVDQTGCNMLCNANATEYCGGMSRLNMYQNGPSVTSTTATASATGIGFSNTTVATTTATPTPTGPITVTQFTGYNYLGCYSENTIGPRALTGKQNPIPGANVSVENCAIACAGYTYFGVEYSAECYCGNTINAPAALVAGTTVAGTKCNMPCKANALEYCGGSNRLNMYQVASVSTTTLAATNTTTAVVVPTTTAGSTTTPGTTTTSTTTTETATSIGTTTSTNTAIAVGTNATTIADTTTTTSVVVDTTTTSVVVDTTTATTATTTLLTTTTTLTTSTSLTTSTPSTTTTTTTTTTPATFSPTPSQDVGNGWVYLGCANETNPRALNQAATADNNAMTVESCQAFCNTNNYGLAGVEYGHECYCGNALQSYSALGFTGCNMACSGNTSEICGGRSRISVYNLTTYVPPTTVKSVGTYVSQGCYLEATTGRLLSGPSYTNKTGMTVESCVAFCAGQKIPLAYAGVEYAQECYCAASLPATAVMTDASSCNMLCTGNKKEFCGAGKHLNILYNDPSAVAPATVSSANAATISPNTAAPAATPT